MRNKIEHKLWNPFLSFTTSRLQYYIADHSSRWPAIIGLYYHTLTQCIRFCLGLCMTRNQIRETNPDVKWNISFSTPLNQCQTRQFGKRKALSSLSIFVSYNNIGYSYLQLLLSSQCCSCRYYICFGVGSSQSLDNRDSSSLAMAFPGLNKYLQ